MFFLWTFIKIKSIHREGAGVARKTEIMIHLPRVHSALAVQDFGFASTSPKHAHQPARGGLTPWKKIHEMTSPIQMMNPKSEIT